MIRENRHAAIAVFLIIFAETLLPCVWIAGELSNGFDPKYGLAIYVPCLLVPLGCSALVTGVFVRLRRRRSLIEGSSSVEDAKNWVDLAPHLTATDYCLLIPLFLLGYAVLRELLAAVLNHVFGVPESQVPTEVTVLVSCVVSASLVVSYTRRTALNRFRRLERQRNQARERRFRDQARRAAALAQMRCPDCGYDITGLPERRCPECGGTWTSTEEQGMPETPANQRP